MCPLGGSAGLGWIWLILAGLLTCLWSPAGAGSSRMASLTSLVFAWLLLWGNLLSGPHVFYLPMGHARLALQFQGSKGAEATGSLEA